MNLNELRCIAVANNMTIQAQSDFSQLPFSGCSACSDGCSFSSCSTGCLTGCSFGCMDTEMYT